MLLIASYTFEQTSMLSILLGPPFSLFFCEWVNVLGMERNLEPSDVSCDRKTNTEPITSH